MWRHERAEVSARAHYIDMSLRAHDDPPDGHRLCNLSYFEFYRPSVLGGLYIHKYPAASAVDQCALTSTDTAPVDVDARPMLFRDITETDVRNLVASLQTNKPLVAGAAAPDARAMYDVGDFVFGYEDVLGWLMRPGTDGPAGLTSCGIAEYLNALEVVRCALVTGAESRAQEWQLTIESATRSRHVVYCRRTPAPQRTLDVVPLILRSDGSVWTTVSRRKRTTTMVDGVEIATVGCTSSGRDTIVGAGEHVETTDLVPELRDMQLAGHDQSSVAGILRAAEPTPVLTRRALKASKRALSEEVGLAPALLERAQLWLLGQHRVSASAAIARDLRYWPRVALDSPVLYGYRRETSTIIYAAVLHIDASDDVDLRPTDTGEICKATLLPWSDVVATFHDAGARRPAFGWAHTEMVRCVDRHVESMVAAYTARKQP